MDPSSLRLQSTENEGQGDAEQPLMNGFRSHVDEGEEAESDSEGEPGDSPASGWRRRHETWMQFYNRFRTNLIHFFVEDWFLSGLLGVLTAIISITTDLGIEYLLHAKRSLYERMLLQGELQAFSIWVLYFSVFTGLAGLFCHMISKQAIGSGIPELKVIMSGIELKNYLSFTTLIAKIVGVIFSQGGGYPVGKEGPFVHMGAIVANLLNKASHAWKHNAFFSTEGRRMEMLSTGCAVGIACTFSAPAGGVLYGIESTSKYFAIKNYWRCFFATTCSALIFRFAMAFILPQHIAGTIVAYYQTSFPNAVFLIVELPLFALLGVICGLTAALFIWLHRQFSLSLKHTPGIKTFWAKNPIVYTMLMCAIGAVVTFPEGLGKYCAGKLTFREALVDLLSNCTFTQVNQTNLGCSPEIVSHWTRDAQFDPFNILITIGGFIIVYFVMVSKFTSLYVPSGIFIPAFTTGAAMGRLMGELLALAFPEGLRGPDYPPIYPGLYAVVGAAAFTGAMTHSLSLAVIVCEATGQLCGLLPVLIALMVANAICAFLRPSIYESIIQLKNLPYLAELPPSRITVHSLKVEKIMVTDMVFITKKMTYAELRNILITTPKLRSYPLVTDKYAMTLLGQVSRHYLAHLLLRKLGPDSQALPRRRSFVASEVFSAIGGTLRRNASMQAMTPRNEEQRHSWHPDGPLTDRGLSGAHLLAHSPLHHNPHERERFAPFLAAHNEPQERRASTTADRAIILASTIDLDDVAIDPAPFQLVKGTSLYKVHTLFSLLALNHAYVTENGRLIGVVALKELRETLAHIYTRGAIPPRKQTLQVSSARKSSVAGNSVRELSSSYLHMLEMKHKRKR
ncbi:unnamed protein product, partial [Mesorhabditis belari]|uniref:Chloride channel protein n=1 Tax=Mesorhabditis belari TaxID=2138241 RepID=A0AAF3JC46_9BILA